MPTLNQYIADRTARDSAFKAAREASAPQREFRASLIEARLRAGLTQAQLADRLGTTQSAVARMEAGRWHPSVAMLERVADALNVEVTIAPHRGLSLAR